MKEFIKNKMPPSKWCVKNVHAPQIVFSKYTYPQLLSRQDIMNISLEIYIQLHLI